MEEDEEEPVDEQYSIRGSMDEPFAGFCVPMEEADQQEEQDDEEGSGSAPRTPLEDMTDALAHSVQWGLVDTSAPKTAGAQRRMSFNDVIERGMPARVLLDPGGLSAPTDQVRPSGGSRVRIGNFEDEFALALTRRMEKVQVWDDEADDSEAIETFGDLPSLVDMSFGGGRDRCSVLGSSKALRRGTVIAGRDRSTDFGLLKARRKSMGLVSGTTTPQRLSCQGSPQSQSRRGSMRGSTHSANSCGGGVPRSIFSLLRRGDASVSISVATTPTRSMSLKGTDNLGGASSTDPGASARRARTPCLSDASGFGGARSAAGRYPCHRSAAFSPIGESSTGSTTRGGHRERSSTSEEEADVSISALPGGLSIFLPTSLPSFRSKRPQHRGFYFDNVALGEIPPPSTSCAHATPGTSGSLSELYSLSSACATF